MSEIKNAQKLVDILHKDCRLSLEQIATMTDMSVAEVGAAIEQLEKDGAILGYGAIVNWDMVPDLEMVSAYIEIKVTPQRNEGFNRIAERIYQYPEVKSLTLISGHYDFGLTVEGKSIKEVSFFVAEHLAPMESVESTSTHFVLKRYKRDGVILDVEPEDEREVISI